VIKLSSVSKTFGSQQVLKDCSLDIDEPGFIAIKGRSGSGKTTLLSLMAGLTNPDAGDVVVAGENISSMNEEARALFRQGHIGIVFQDFKLIPSLSLSDNVYVAIYPRRDLPVTTKIARVNELIAAVGLTDKKSERVANLSGGEKQRVAIARSLVNYPAVVLADEPTGNLDAQTAGDILNLFAAMRARFDTLFVVVTHDDEVASRAQNTYHLAEGVITQ